MPARLRLSWDMKTWKLFFLSVLESLEFGWQVIPYGQNSRRARCPAHEPRFKHVHDKSGSVDPLLGPDR